MKHLRALYDTIVSYASTSDPRLQIAFTTVIAVVGNQPFYPAYVWWIVGAAATPAFISWLSTPFFAAVPAVARRSPRWAKVLLIFAGLGNTTLCAMTLGRASGVELFYLPCLLLAVLLFQHRSRVVSIGVSVLWITSALALTTFASPERFTPAENESLLKLHAVSVACLVLLLAYRAWRVFAFRGQDGPKIAR